MGLGGVGFDVFLRTFLNGQRSKCVIRHISFGEVTEVVFDYTATDLKNQWVSFHLQFFAKEKVVDYFNWLKENETNVGNENLDTPPSFVQ